MVFTKDPFTFSGGCNCKAVRYRASIPPWHDRPETPYRTPGADIGDNRLPCSVICHCNDCRAATAQIGMHGLVAHAATLEISSLGKSNPSAASSSPREWISGDDFMNKPEIFDDESSCLTRYCASPKRNRWFCVRCGTPVAYTLDADALPGGWPLMVDLSLGTVDREYLEKEYFRPDHALWTALGIPWVREQVRDGAGVTEHPFVHIDKAMGSDTTEVVEFMKKRGKTVNITITE